MDVRLDQVQKDGIGFREFLELLLEDEVQHRANKRLATRIIRAHFEEEKSLEGFDFNRDKYPYFRLFASLNPTKYLYLLFGLDDFAFKDRREFFVGFGLGL